MKSYSTRQFKNFMKNANAKGFDQDCKQFVLLISRAKTKERRMLRMTISTLFPLDQSVSDVKVLDI